MPRTDEVRQIRLASSDVRLKKRAVINFKLIEYEVTAPLLNAQLQQMQGMSRREKRANLREYKKRVKQFQKALQRECRVNQTEKNPSSSA